jgi:hypothetical protein
MRKPAWLITISIVLFTSLGIHSVAQSNANDNPQVSKKLQVPTDQRLVFKSAARGSQIYICQQIPADRSQFEWKLKAPEAKLFDAQGKVVGKHYAGPTPWLLLQVKSTTGKGKFTNVKWVQRLNTTGGIASPECNRDRLNTEISVPYTADYYFYSSNAQKNYRA